MACVYVYVMLLTFLGPEYLGRDFHVENDEDMIAAATPDAMGVFHKGHDSGEVGREGPTQTEVEKV